MLLVLQKLGAWRRCRVAWLWGYGLGSCHCCSWGKLNLIGRIQKRKGLRQNSLLYLRVDLIILGDAIHRKSIGVPFRLRGRRIFLLDTEFFHHETLSLGMDG